MWYITTCQVNYYINALLLVSAWEKKSFITRVFQRNVLRRKRLQSMGRKQVSILQQSQEKCKEHYRPLNGPFGWGRTETIRKEKLAQSVGIGWQRLISWMTFFSFTLTLYLTFLAVGMCYRNSKRAFSGGTATAQYLFHSLLKTLVMASRPSWEYCLLSVS